MVEAATAVPVNCEIVAIGTELLLGQVVDTNSAWIAQQLAEIGIDSHLQTKVGDNLERMIEVVDAALDRSDAVIVCGGLGPTPDDITREALAELMGTELIRNQAVADRIRAMFGSRGRAMPENNLRQADLPAGAEVNPVQPGTACGLICPVRRHGTTKLIYAVPGVPWEMREMVRGGVLPDLRRRAGVISVIRSLTLRTWGCSESALAELLDAEMARLDDTGEATIAFLASGWEGLKVRITAKAPNEQEASRVLEAEASQISALLGDVVFGRDDDTMESVTLDLLAHMGLSLGLAEALTGGLISARLLANGAPGATFRGALVPGRGVLAVELFGRLDGSHDGSVDGSPDGSADDGLVDGPWVSAGTARTLARRAAALLGSDIGLATLGVVGSGLAGAGGPDVSPAAATAGGEPSAVRVEPDLWPGPDPEPGTVWIGLWLAGHGEALKLHLPFDDDRIRQFTTISALDLLRKRLLAGRAVAGSGEPAGVSLPSGAVFP